MKGALRDELEGLIPDPEPVPETEDDNAWMLPLQDEARAFLELPDDAPLEDVQADFAASLERFWEFFFPHYRVDEETGETVEGAAFHVQLRQRWQDLVMRNTTRKEEAVACPREHSKSVNGSFALPLWALASGHRRYGFLFSDTDTQAWGFLEDVRTEIENNERLQAVYPEFCQFEGLPRVNRLVFGNKAILAAAGSGKSVRGARKGSRRPDLIILDDIENDEEVENPKRRRKKMTWYNKVVKKLGRAAVYLIVGTILHAESFLAQRIQNPQADVYRAIAAMPANMKLWEEWERIYHDRATRPNRQHREIAALAFYEANREAMDAGAQVLWPAKFTLYELMVERAEDLASFLSERQNDPFDPAGSYFPEESLQFLPADELPALDQVRFSVLFWDPSRGTSKSDTSAAFRLDYLHDGRRVVREGVAARIPPEEVMDTIIGYHRVRAFVAVGVEKVALSSYDEQLGTKSRAAGVSLPVVPVTPQGEKTLRIKSMRPLVVSGGLLFAEGLPREALQQIKYFGQHPNDDCWDAIQQANALADSMVADVEPAGATSEPDVEALRVEVEALVGDLRPDGMPAFGARPSLFGRSL